METFISAESWTSRSTPVAGVERLLYQVFDGSTTTHLTVEVDGRAVELGLGLWTRSDLTVSGLDWLAFTDHQKENGRRLGLLISERRPEKWLRRYLWEADPKVYVEFCRSSHACDCFAFVDISDSPEDPVIRHRLAIAKDLFTRG